MSSKQESTVSKTMPYEELLNHMRGSFYYSLLTQLEALDKKYNKIRGFGAVNYIIASEDLPSTKEFLRRNYTHTHNGVNYYDLSDLHETLNCYKMPYTITTNGRSIVVQFIKSPPSDDKE